jgi:hypothetical protein
VRIVSISIKSPGAVLYMGFADSAWHLFRPGFEIESRLFSTLTASRMPTILILIITSIERRPSPRHLVYVRTLHGVS